MFVYVWRCGDEPFYVGMTKSIGSTNPLNSGGRGWLCRQTLERVGRHNVITEIHHTDTLEAAQALEKELIARYGRIQLGTGSLTNLKSGGDGWQGMSVNGVSATRKRMLENNPMHNPEIRAKVTARMHDPDVKARFLGANNPAKKPEVRAKIKAKWQDPEYRAARSLEKIGKKKHSAEHKQSLRKKLLDPTNPLREYHKTLNTDPAIKAKRVAALQTPEIRAKISEALRLAWARRKNTAVAP